MYQHYGQHSIRSFQLALYILHIVFVCVIFYFEVGARYPSYSTMEKKELLRCIVLSSNSDGIGCRICFSCLSNSPAFSVLLRRL